jgi:prepilin-type processing-associated H-X9-DG protein
MQHRPERGSTRRHAVAFTLVELLVVIGIIAVLISILLPVLGSARRQAAAAKCAASMREIGNAFAMYAMENKGYYPPLRCITNYRLSFSSNPPINYDGPQTYWMYFLAKYVSKGKFGKYTGATAQDAAYAMNSVLWGCPAFQPIASASTTIAVGGVAVVYTGYGMNGFPEYTPTYPPLNADQYNLLGDGLSPGLDTRAVSAVNCTPAQNWSNITTGRWYKQKAYTNPAERALIGDCRVYVLEAMSAPGPQGIAAQADLSGSIFWAGGPDPGQTSYDFYRHGKYPKRANANTFNKVGGNVAYNVLYADGHVRTLVMREEGFKAARMRWPG